VSKSGIVEWRQREVIEEIAGVVQENMEIAAEVVKIDARHRLLRIREPEFGRKYRMVLALYRMITVVTRKGDVIEGRVGLPPGDKGTRYGFYIETGSRTAPAQPWLRPALYGNLRRIQQLLIGG